MKMLNTLRLKVPPPLLFLLCGAMMQIMPKIYPLVLPYPLLFLCVGLAIFLNLASFISFKRVKTTITPLNPNSTSVLVTHGIYRFTRNPMYLSLVLLLCAWAIYLANLSAWIVIPLFIFTLNQLQIIPEEQILAEKFGKAYLDYQKQVGRWLL